jgi:hypothetical protein
MVRNTLNTRPTRHLRSLFISGEKPLDSCNFFRLLRRARILPITSRPLKYP